MANIRIVLRKEVKKDGTSPLAIRITKDRKTSYIYLNYSVNSADWDEKNQKIKKSYPNATRLNNFIAKQIAETSNKVIELETQRNDVSVRAVRNNLKPTVGNTFFKQADIYIEDLRKSGKYNRVSAEKPRITRLKEFLKGEDIAFSDITVALLNKFKIHLKSTRNINDRTVMNHLVTIRSIFSQAIKEKIIDEKFYPFGRNKVVIKFADSLKLGLSTEEVRKIEELELDAGSPLNNARNIWLFAFYFAGMRVSDVLRLKWSDFQDERLHYSMGKNAKGGSLKTPEKALKILMQYEAKRRDKDDLVFPQLKNLEDLNDKYAVQKQISNAVSTLNKALKLIAEKAEIDKPLTMHIARHTFGNISGERIPVQMLQKLYRHSSITTTIGYQANFIHKDADEALDAVLEF